MGSVLRAQVSIQAPLFYEIGEPVSDASMHTSLVLANMLGSSAKCFSA